MNQFEFPTQGKQYAALRPTYPPSFLTQILAKTKNRNRYLDVATGTGQLLLALSSAFQHSTAIDLSPTMLEVLSPLIEKRNDITLLHGDFLASSQLSQEGLFDLVTIGQAIHWMPIRQSLSRILQLSKGGTACVLGYCCEYPSFKDDIKISETLLADFQTMYAQVKPMFDFDRDDLHNAYSDPIRYPFDEVWGHHEKLHERVVIPMPYKNYIGYIRTFSGYNQHRVKKPMEQDPLHIIEQRTDFQNLIIDCNFNFFARIKCQ